MAPVDVTSIVHSDRPVDLGNGSGSDFRKLGGIEAHVWDIECAVWSAGYRFRIIEEGSSAVANRLLLVLFSDSIELISKVRDEGRKTFNIFDLFLHQIPQFLSQVSVCYPSTCPQVF